MASAALSCLLLAAALSGAPADDEEVPPDIEFLEYLGMWDDADEVTWPLLNKDEENETDDGSDPVPQSEESQELEDEH